VEVIGRSRVQTSLAVEDISLVVGSIGVLPDFEVGVQGKEVSIPGALLAVFCGLLFLFSSIKSSFHCLSRNVTGLSFVLNHSGVGF
jgi:hypothetical protein